MMSKYLLKEKAAQLWSLLNSIMYGIQTGNFHEYNNSRIGKWYIFMPFMLCVQKYAYIVYKLP